MGGVTGAGAAPCGRTTCATLRVGTDGVCPEGGTATRSRDLVAGSEGLCFPSPQAPKEGQRPRTNQPSGGSQYVQPPSVTTSGDPDFVGREKRRHAVANSPTHFREMSRSLLRLDARFLRGELPSHHDGACSGPAFPTRAHPSRNLGRGKPSPRCSLLTCGQG